VQIERFLRAINALIAPKNNEKSLILRKTNRRFPVQGSSFGKPQGATRTVTLERVKDLKTCHAERSEASLRLFADRWMKSNCGDPSVESLSF